MTEKIVAQKDKAGTVAAAAPLHKIRITLSSRDQKKAHEVAKRLVQRAKDKGNRVQGPVKMPTKHLKITTRKTPCGEGSKTWDRFEMKIHKNLVNVWGSTDDIRNITSVPLEAGVEVEVSVV